MAEDEEWVTVRRRRNKPATVVKALPIPVLPLTFSALHVEENKLEAADKEKEAEKKRRRKEKKAQAAAMQAPSTAAWGSAAEVASAAAADRRMGPSGAVDTDVAASPSRVLSFLSMLLGISLFQAVFAWLRSMLGGGAKRKKRERKPARSKEAQEQQQPPEGQQQQPPPTPADAKRTGPLPTPSVPAKDKAAAATAVQAASASHADKAGDAVAATPAPAAPTQAQQASASVASSKPEQQPQQHQPRNAKAPELSSKPQPLQQPQQAQQAKAKPAPPCDADWARGRFLVCEAPNAHADVIASVALAGEVVLSSGYDGAIKVWRWPSGGALHQARNLTGHTGRVEALALNGATGERAASSGRDSTLKVWDLTRDSSSATASHYVYESVRCMAVDWASGAAALGCQSGSVAVWDLERGRKLQVLKGHSEEVCSLLHAGASQLFSGGRDAMVNVWDLRSNPAAKTAVLTGFKGRACSLSCFDHLLYVGDCSSSVKVFDLRAAGSQLPAFRVPNAPSFAGDVCPVAALHRDGPCGVLVSSSIGWYTENKQALEEAPEDEDFPIACLNVHACGSGGAAPSATPHEYLYTLRTSPGIATCMAVASGSGPGGSRPPAGSVRLALGLSTGALVGLSLVRGSANRAGAGGGGGGVGGVVMEEGLAIGVEEYSDDEEEEDDE